MITVAMERRKMDKYIKKESAVNYPVMPKKYRKYPTMNLDDAYEQGWKDLKPDKIHSIDFQEKQYDEVRYGKWIDPEDSTCYKCSVCGEYATQEYGLTEPIFWRYCPNCGAKMEEVENE